MTLRITGKHMEVGDALRGRIEQRVEESVSKYFGGGYSGRVILTKEGSGFSADCMVALDSGTSFQTAGEAQDAHAAFDIAAERLDKRLRRYKRKLKSHSGSSPAVKVEEAAYRVLTNHDEDDETYEAEGGAEAGPAIVSEHAFQFGTMSVAAAAAALDAKNDAFFVFRNASNGQVNVVYHRPDGNIGWIDPSNGLA